MLPVFEAAGTTSNGHKQRMPSKDLFSLDMSVADGREGNNKDFSATIVIYPFKNKKNKKIKKKGSFYYQNHLAEHFTVDPEQVPNCLLYVNTSTTSGSLQKENVYN